LQWHCFARSLPDVMESSRVALARGLASALFQGISRRNWSEAPRRRRAIDEKLRMRQPAELLSSPFCADWLLHAHGSVRQ
jgi:hypothetical protein